MGGGESTSSLSLEPRYLSVGSQAFLPRLGMLASLGSVEKVFEPHVDERKSCLSQKVVRLPQLPADEDAAPALFLDPGVHREGAVDRNGPAVAEEHASRHRRKAVPGRDEPARLVDQRRDQPAVRQARPALVALVEREGRLVAIRALALGLWEVEADRVVAAPEARRVVVRRDLQRMPPRSKCALKKFSDPDVAIAADAEISRASVAAATICAKR
jgi:hypothetical protein